MRCLFTALSKPRFVNMQRKLFAHTFVLVHAVGVIHTYTKCVECGSGVCHLVSNLILHAFSGCDEHLTRRNTNFVMTWGMGTSVIKAIAYNCDHRSLKALDIVLLDDCWMTHLSESAER